MHFRSLKKVFEWNSVLLVLFSVIFILFPKFDIFLSNLFFYNGSFISENFVFIKELRVFLKNLMIIIPIVALFCLIIDFIRKKNRKKVFFSLRSRIAMVGFLVGPIIGCGLIANLYFKDTWGRARPVHIEEFGGNKIFTGAFKKSSECQRNCSWISGETSAAFSFMVGSLLLKNQIFVRLNIILGFMVFFCRQSMGGHFFSDNIFAMIFMIYLAILYKTLIYLCFKKRLFSEKNISNY